MLNIRETFLLIQIKLLSCISYSLTSWGEYLFAFFQFEKEMKTDRKHCTALDYL